MSQKLRMDGLDYVRPGAGLAFSCAGADYPVIFLARLRIAHCRAGWLVLTDWFAALFLVLPGFSR